jgi:hypothetical protein
MAADRLERAAVTSFMCMFVMFSLVRPATVSIDLQGHQGRVKQVPHLSPEPHSQTCHNVGLGSRMPQQHQHHHFYPRCPMNESSIQQSQETSKIEFNTGDIAKGKPAEDDEVEIDGVVW